MSLDSAIDSIYSRTNWRKKRCMFRTNGMMFFVAQLHYEHIVLAVFQRKIVTHNQKLPKEMKLLILVFAILAIVGAAEEEIKCDANKKCPPKYVCSSDGTCLYRCPTYVPERVPTGCRLKNFTDRRGCERVKIGSSFHLRHCALVQVTTHISPSGMTQSGRHHMRRKPSRSVVCRPVPALCHHTMKLLVVVCALLACNVGEKISCDEKTPCPAGNVCIDQICTRYRCPMYVPARPRPGCRVKVTTDKMGCNHPSIICDKQNVK
ncbi:unnamed protein product [Cylicocyclus nassatus]|uniref:Uncharacterized protein n=1 Tax=Cylicocyclus nassatus TaxID=53992 RepID=A0AA36H9Y9_CYLNA|nr:unnamed protein product [Cylicocyclus nassatus]